MLMRSLVIISVLSVFSLTRPPVARTQSAASPEFVTRRVGAVWSCGRSSKATVGVGGGSEWSIVTVFVQNLGNLAVEPLTFSFEHTAEGKSHETTVERVPAPVGKRIGRPVLPGATMDYELLVPLPPAIANNASVGVRKVQCFTGKYTSQQQVKILSKISVSVKSEKLGRQVNRSQIKIENKGERPVDVVCHVVFRIPKETQALYTIRLNRKETKNWIIDYIPGSTRGADSDFDISKIEILDWCELYGSADEPEMETPKAKPIVNVPKGAPPAGPDANALKAIWNATYRYPDEEVSITGEFTAEIPADDVIWRGQRKLSGSFTLEGFKRGMWTSRNFIVKSPSLGGPTERALADLVGDRFLMWFPVDLSGRAPFDEAFAGATIARKNGVFTSTSGPYERFEIENGRFSRLIRSSKTSGWTIEYEQIAGHWVAKSYKSGLDLFRATWKKVADGWLFPETFEFRGTFEKGWGPERFTLSKVQVVKG
ncbi:MAG: hypothetical protein ACKVS6_12465 [Planctomycetota bacterium]